MGCACCSCTAVPYMKMGGQAVADHLKSQEPKVLAGYALFIAAVIGFILLRRLVLSELICYAAPEGAGKRQARFHF